MRVVGGFTVVSLSSDGRRLAIGQSNGSISIMALEGGALLGCLYEPELTEIGTEVSQGRLMGSETREIPCETPLPADAVCLCDCVEASRAYETADAVCTCDTVTVPAIHKSEGFTCACDTISVGAKEPPPPPPPPTRRNKSSCSSGRNTRSSGGHYWKPN